MKKLNAKSTTIRFIQHILAAFIAFVISYGFIGTNILIEGINGSYSYNLYESDRGRSYEDSYLFNNILGNNISDVMRLVALKTQLESSGTFDDKKEIDVTAYVNKSASLSGDYITAVYYLSDLLKWAQNGFNYETKFFSEEESEAFLSPATTYTHLNNNIHSGGMNTYLNSQIRNNSMTFAISGNSAYEDGKHTYLLNRYQTVDGKNIEDIVSTWEEYNLICSYVEEAAKDLLRNYEDYLKAQQYYEQENSNLRYYITRNINGRTDVYTNVEDLKGETTGKDIKAIFQDYGRYIYYCPYEISYETNTLIKENVLRTIIKNYSYAYPDQIKVYLAVDTNNFAADDSFMEGKKNFTRYMPYKTQLYILCLFAALMYIVLMALYIRRLPVKGSFESAVASIEGRKFYSEVILIAGLVIMALPALGFFVLGLINGSYEEILKYTYFPYLCAAGAFIFNIGFLYLVYGLLRKIRNGSVWKDSFLRAVILGAKNFIINTTDNGNVIIRSWVPYIFFVGLNLMLFMLGLSGIVIAILFDILVGVFLYRQNLDRDRIIGVIEKIKNGDVKAKVDTKDLHSDNIKLAEAVNSIGEGIDMAVNTSMKDEKLKADLITNVSHDIKTPLTSIINYVDLIKREDIDNEKVKEYVNILDLKSQKLKQLTEDLLEASKISSGNISIELSRINFVELVNQTIGEFYEKLEKNSLQVVFKSEMPVMMIMADARHLWRVIENLLNNVCKYALSGTRVYMDMHLEKKESGKDRVVLSIKNISASELNIDASELTERFIRGDVSRTTEGSGLGLSIAKNLTNAQGGDFEIKLDGDLFKVIIGFDCAQEV